MKSTYFSIFSISCLTTTPGIKGVILNEKTKEVVPEDWLMAGVSFDISILQGHSGGIRIISKLHTKTNKKGKFYTCPEYDFKKALLLGEIIGNKQNRKEHHIKYYQEIFFKMLKQNLKIEKFVGTKAGAIKIQIWN